MVFTLQILFEIASDPFKIVAVTGAIVYGLATLYAIIFICRNAGR